MCRNQILSKELKVDQRDTVWKLKAPHDLRLQTQDATTKIMTTFDSACRTGMKTFKPSSLRPHIQGPGATWKLGVSWPFIIWRLKPALEEGIQECISWDHYQDGNTLTWVSRVIAEHNDSGLRSANGQLLSCVKKLLRNGAHLVQDNTKSAVV